MLNDDQLIERLRTALERESAGVAPPPDLLATIHDQLRSSPAAELNRRRAAPPRSRLRLAHLAPVAAVLVVVAVVAVFLGVQGRKPVTPAAAGSGLMLVYRAEPTPQSKVTPQSLQRAVDTMEQRVNQLGVSEPEISTQGCCEITVRLPHVQNAARAEALVGQTARLEFYDWEANALTPSGQSVASLMPTQNPAAVAISAPTSSAGSPGVGSMSLYPAVQLAAKQPLVSDGQCSRQQCSRKGGEYFAFAKAGSPNCAIAGRRYRVTEIVGQPCPLLSSPATSVSELYSSLPAGVAHSEVQVLVVKQGMVILQAVPSGGFGHEIAWSNPSAQFFVLRDHVALFGDEITNPRQSTDQSGEPDVTFGFSAKGKTAFQDLTQTIAHRAALTNGSGQPQENQHFAVVLDTQLITVPQIDYEQYPDGIDSDSADIAAGFTRESARDLAAELRLGSLPISLRLITVLPRR